MLFARSTAILTDALPIERRGFALGINQIVGIARTFLGLIVGSVLAELHGHAVFIVSVPFGIFGSGAVSGAVSGSLSDRFGARAFATGGLLLVAATFVALLLVPVDLPYWLFALITFLNRVGSGLFAARNRTAIMNSVPANQGGAASGMTGTFQNAGNSLSIGIFSSLSSPGRTPFRARALRAPRHSPHPVS